MLRLLIVLFILPILTKAQPILTGLGNYRSGLTKPDHLAPAGFSEQDQYVKGTLALACPHVRKFTTDQLYIDGTLIMNLSLYFYDDTLFRISCDYTDAIYNRFLSTLAKGDSLPVVRIKHCPDDPPQTTSGRFWQNTKMAVIAVRCQGYDDRCQLKDVARLTIFHKATMALSSECELEPDYPFLEKAEMSLER